MSYSLARDIRQRRQDRAGTAGPPTALCPGSLLPTIPEPFTSSDYIDRRRPSGSWREVRADRCSCCAGLLDLKAADGTHYTRAGGQYVAPPHVAAGAPVPSWWPDVLRRFNR